MSGTHTLNEVPVLNSLPGATKAIYLDFNGDAAIHNTPAFDLDGDVSTFTDGELASMTKIWQTVAEKFSPFNVNVTTVPTAGATKCLIGGNGEWLGIPEFGWTSGGMGYVFSGVKGQDAPVSIGDYAAHVLGHALNLDHQMSFNADGTLKTEYNPGTMAKVPIMGAVLGPRSQWWYGPSRSANSYQDDVALLAAKFGLRPDEANKAISGTVNESGVIGTLADQDSFVFSTAGGAVSFKVDSLFATGGMLNPALKLLDGNGNTLAAADGAGELVAYKLGETISLNLGAGNYTLVVYSHGEYGDIGQYTLTGTIGGALQPPSPTPEPTPSPSPIIVAPTAPTLQSATSLSTSQVKLTWADNASNESGFLVERSTDGVGFAQVASLGSNAVTWTDSGRSAATKYFYRISAYNSAGSAQSTVIAASTLGIAVPATPANLSVTAASNSQLNLRWADVANETGYQVERSTDGVNFSQIASTGPGVVTYNDAGRASGVQYVYRVRAYNAGGNSAYSNLATGTPPATTTTPATSTNSVTLANPADFNATYVGGHGVKLSWADTNTAETGYEVWKSVDGVRWTMVKTLAADSTAWTTTNDNAYGKSYQWKVRAVNKYSRAVSSFTIVLSTAIPSDGLLSTWESWQQAQAA